MRLALFLLAAPLFAAAGGGTTLIDSAGNIWSTGPVDFLLTTPTAFQKTATQMPCGIQTLSPFSQSTTISCLHAYLTKQDPAGKVLYATYLAGVSQDAGTALTSDAQGNIYVTGYTYSPDFPVTAGVVQPKNAGPVGPLLFTTQGAPFGPVVVVPGGDVFVAKFAPDGALLFSTFLGGSKSDVPNLIAVDSSGSIYVSGFTLSTDFPVTSNALTGQGTSNFFAVLNSTGTALIYSTYYESAILAFDVDNQGNAYLTGGSTQPYVTVLDAVSGAISSSAEVPGLAGAGVAIALTPSQNLMLVVSPAPPAYSFNGSTYTRQTGDSYLVELNLGGSIVAQTHFPLSEFDSILIDTSGNVYAFGNGRGAIPAAPVHPLDTPCSPSGGSFVVEMNPAGTVLASTYFRQGDDTAVEITSPGHLTLYRTASSTTVPMDLSAQPTSLFGCGLNLATGFLGSGLAPGEIFMLTGAGLGPSQGVGAVPNATGQYPTSLGGVQVLMGTTPLPLLYVSATEIHAVAPFGLPSPVGVQVEFGNNAPPPIDLIAAQVNPGIFEVNGQGAIINQDGAVNTPANPAPLGSIVSVYCTGAGYLEYPVTDGSVAPIPPPFDVTEVPDFVLTFAGVQGTTLWSGAAPELIEGLTQINVQLPVSLPAGTSLSAVPVILSGDGVYSPPVYISVKQ